jgi:hypothetical protein
VSVQAALKQIRQVLASRLAATPAPLLTQLREDPARLLSLSGMPPDPWQAECLRREAASGRMILLCSRQAGKSLTAAALALRSALLSPPALVLLLSPTLRQSGELYRDKVLRLFNALGRPVPVVQESALQMTLGNGSRVISLPGAEGTIRGYSGVSLLVIDEAARVPDDLYRAVRPMLATSRGQLVCLSTPFGKRGWFWEEWVGTNSWHRLRVTAEQCPRIPADFLEEERQALGPRWYAQEYGCSFEETVDAVFLQSDIEAAFDETDEPLFSGGVA